MKSNKNIFVIFGLFVCIVICILLLLDHSNMSPSQNNVSNNSQHIISPGTQESPTFIDTVWTATTIDNASPLHGSTLTVQFAKNGTVTGFDGCNNFRSSYTLHGSTLSVNPQMVSTLVGCSTEVMEQANNFTALLIASTRIVLDKNGVLELLQGNTAGLTFTGQANTLSNTSWNVTSYNNGNQAVVSPILDTNLTILFDDDGTISGSAGCNTYSGTYSINGKSISISQLAITERMCIEPEGIMEQESSFITYLQQADTWHLQGNQLSLRTPEDQLAVIAIKN